MLSLCRTCSSYYKLSFILQYDLVGVALCSRRCITLIITLVVNRKPEITLSSLFEVSASKVCSSVLYLIYSITMRVGLSAEAVRPGAELGRLRHLLVFYIDLTGRRDPLLRSPRRPCRSSSTTTSHALLPS